METFNISSMNNRIYMWAMVLTFVCVAALLMSYAFVGLLTLDPFKCLISFGFGYMFLSASSKLYKQLKENEA